jgi:xanthosine utilization system XapX-like protein
VGWSRPSPPPPSVTAMLVVAIEVQEQLLAQERELDSREGVIATWEDGLATSEHALGRACMERDAKHIQAEAVQ